MALTRKKRLFAEARVNGKSSKDAALRAGYSAKTAAQAGSRLVKDVDVQMLIAQLQKKGDAMPAPSIAPGPELAADAVPEVPADSPAIAEGNQKTGAILYSDPKAFLMAAMNDLETEPKLRVDAAKALMPFVHGKVGDLGKKTARGDEAKKISSGRFGPSAPPALKAVK